MEKNPSLPDTPDESRDATQAILDLFPALPLGLNEVSRLVTSAVRLIGTIGYKSADDLLGAAAGEVYLLP